MENLYSFAPSTDPAEYDAFVTSQPNCNLLQSSKWAKIKEGWDSSLMSLRNTRGEIVAAGLVLKRPIKFGLTFWYLPHGPILDYSNTEVLTAFLNGLTAEAKKSKAISVRIDPPVPLKSGEPGNFPEERDPAALAIKDNIEATGFQHGGFFMGLHETLQPRFMTATMRPEEGKDVMSILPRRTKDLVKRAKKRHAESKRGTIDDLDEFMDVITETEHTKDITLRSRHYYELIMETYGDDAVLQLGYLDIKKAIEIYKRDIEEGERKLAELPVESKNKRSQLESQIASYKKNLAEITERQAIDGDYVTLAGCLSVRYGHAFEMLYAGTNRNYGTMPAQDLIWVDILQDAFDNGASYVSLGGVDGSLEDSLLEFKSRFSPVIYEKLGEFDYPIIKPLAKALRWFLAHR